MAAKKKPEITAVETVKKTNTAVCRPLPLSSMQEVSWLADQLARSGVVESAPEGVFVVATCTMRNQDPLTFLQENHIINGRVSRKADAMAAKLLDMGGEYEIHEHSPEKADATFTSGKRTFRSTVTIDDAKAAGYCFNKKGEMKENWKSPRQQAQMLWARCVSDGVRVVDPRVNTGTYTPEEVQDFDDVPRSRPETPVAPPVSAPAPAAPIVTPDAVIPPEKPASADVDMDIIPCSNHAGKRWSDMTVKTLAKFLQVIGSMEAPMLTEAYRPYIQSAKMKKEAAAGKEAKNGE